MVVHHNDIIFKVGLLLEGTLHSIADGLLTIKDRNDHRGLEFELLFVKVGATIERWVDLGTNLLQMSCGSNFHLNLYLTVTRIHVVELLDTRSPGIRFFLRIEFLVDVEELTFTTQEEA